MPKVAKSSKANFTSREKSLAIELAKHENKWVAIASKGNSDRIVGSGERITDAKREAESKGVKNAVYRKVPSSHKILIARFFRAGRSHS